MGLTLMLAESDGSRMEMSAVSVGLALLLMGLNFAISWFNAWSCGRAWGDAKAAGGWTLFITWCGAIMSACGFTWVYTLLLAFGLGAAGKLSPQLVEGTIQLGYLVIIIPVIGSGLGITAHSLGVFWRRKSLGNGLVGGWNTFAQIHNTVSAIRSVPPILDNVLKLFKNDKKGGLIVLILVLVATIGGILTTAAIIRATARRYSSKVYDDVFAGRRAPAAA